MIDFIYRNALWFGLVAGFAIGWVEGRENLIYRAKQREMRKKRFGDGS